MPLFQHAPKQGALALTKDKDRIVAYAMTPAAVRKLREAGVRHGRKFPASILASLIRTGDAHSPRLADHAGQITLWGDDDTEQQLPRCEMTGTTADLHLVVYGDGMGTVVKLLGQEPRFVLQKVTRLSIPIWVLTTPLLDQLQATGVIPATPPAAATLRTWFRKNYDDAWAKLQSGAALQESLDLGTPADELPLVRE
jgi:hypothetical protein